MTKKERQFVAQAVERKHDEFQEIYIINSGRLYNGTFGKNGYNDIIVIGRVKGCSDYELITTWSDAVWITDTHSFTIDIDNKTGITRLYFDQPISLEGLPLSTTCFEGRMRR